MALNIGCEVALNRIQNKKFVRQFPPDRQYLIAVSGGRDSVALLQWLIECGYGKLVVCHLNHQIRGRASQADAAFVEKLASRCELDFVVESVNVRELAAKGKLSVEAAGRVARYKFFARVARQKNCRTIFVGHQADDVVETFLINLFRGSGTSGLAAIREISTRQIGRINLEVVRPFLGVWRNEIDRYVRAHRFKFREDASNKDLAPLRNRIRLRIIPYLEEKLGRNIRQSLWRAAMIAAEEEVWIESQLPHGSNTELVVSKLRDLPVAVQRREILRWLRGQNISNVGFDVVESVRALLDHDSKVAKVNLSQNRHVRRRAKKIFITG